MSDTTAVSVLPMDYVALRDRIEYPPTGPRLARHEWQEVVGTPAEAIYNSMREVGASWMWANFFGNRFGTDERGRNLQEQLLGTEGVPAHLRRSQPADDDRVPCMYRDPEWGLCSGGRRTQHDSPTIGMSIDHGPCPFCNGMGRVHPLADIGYELTEHERDTTRLFGVRRVGEHEWSDDTVTVTTADLALRLWRCVVARVEQEDGSLRVIRLGSRLDPLDVGAIEHLRGCPKCLEAGKAQDDCSVCLGQFLMRDFDLLGPEEPLWGWPWARRRPSASILALCSVKYAGGPVIPFIEMGTLNQPEGWHGAWPPAAPGSDDIGIENSPPHTLAAAQPAAAEHYRRHQKEQAATGAPCRVRITADQYGRRGPRQIASDEWVWDGDIAWQPQAEALAARLPLGRLHLAAREARLTAARLKLEERPDDPLLLQWAAQQPTLERPEPPPLYP